MSWMMLTQWLASIALIFYGIDAFSVNVAQVVKQSETFFYSRQGHGWSCFLEGLFRGVVLQGRLGYKMIKQRLLAGLFSPFQLLFFSSGMAVGVMVVPLILYFLPEAIGWSLLTGGLMVWLISMGRSRSAKLIGLALIGLGCCWLGVATSQTHSPLLQKTFILGLAPVLPVLTFFLRTPAAIWLVVVTSIESLSTVETSILGGMAMLGWMVQIWVMTRTLDIPFVPKQTLLPLISSTQTHAFLTLLLLEIKRIMQGIADKADLVFPRSFDDLPHDHHVFFDVECAINEFKEQAQYRVSTIASQKRFASMAHALRHLYLCIGDIERIGDHIQAVSEQKLFENIMKPSIEFKGLQKTTSDLNGCVLALLQTIPKSISLVSPNYVDINISKVLECHAAFIASLDALRQHLENALENKYVNLNVATTLRILLSHVRRIGQHVYAMILALKACKNCAGVQPDVSKDDNESSLNKDEADHVRGPDTAGGCV